MVNYQFSWPLEWPDDYEVTAKPIPARFRVSAAQARDEMLYELQQLGAKEIVITTDVPVSKKGQLLTRHKSTGSEGVAVYFSRNDQPYVIACDQYDQVWDNLRAVGLTVQAIRSIERHGTKQLQEKAMRGLLKQLPPSAQAAKPWWQELELAGPDATEEAIKQQHRKLVKLYHPVQGTDPDAGKFSQVQEAYQFGLRQRKVER